MTSIKRKSRTNSIAILENLVGNLSRRQVEDIYKDLRIEEEHRLLEGIMNQSYSSDYEACFNIFGTSTSNKYNRIKSNLRDRIIYQIIKYTPGLEDHKSYASTFFRVNSQNAAFNILARKGQNKAAIYLAELIISASIKYDFGDFILPATSFLIEQFSIQNYNPKKIKYYRQVYEKYLLSNQMEQEARLMYSELMNLFIVEFSPGQKANNLAENYLPRLEPYLKKIPSTTFHFHTYLMQVFHHYARKDYTNMHKSAIEGFEYFHALTIKRPYIENTFLKKSVEAKLVLGDFEYCLKKMHHVLGNSKLGQNNWYNSLEIMITINLHTKKYEKATTAFLLGKNNSNFKSLLKNTRSRWGLLEAYINFLQLAGVAPESPTMSRFRINRFINETPQYEEDKKGRNIQLIIAQLLFYIIDKNWDKMGEKIDALQKYGTRYLRKNELFRSQVFIKMLLEIPRRMYHPQAILRHTAKYRKRLEEMAPNIDLNGSTLEIIPYEHLWELIIKNIVPPKYTRKSKILKAESV